MEWLNYHHLLYFWQVARLGSVTRASEELNLSPSTISTQVKALEESLGEPLLRRAGRSLVLTEVGRVVSDYAEEIFSLGGELLHVVRERPTGQPLRLAVGLSDVLAKLVVREILLPAFSIEEPIRMVCREGGLDGLLGELAAYRLDIVLSDRPAPETTRVKTFDHHLGGCGLTFLAAPNLAEFLGPDFPRSLDGAPAMLPTPNTMLRQSLEGWFKLVGVRPRVVAEFEDQALLKVFAGDGLGFFAVPDVVASQVASRYGALPFAHTDDCREEFYAISAERRLQHAAVIAITAAARDRLFGGHLAT